MCKTYNASRVIGIPDDGSRSTGEWPHGRRCAVGAGVGGWPSGLITWASDAAAFPLDFIGRHV
ncbi:hypothetical protein MHI32_16130 [Paenibacillus sp. FSL H7-0690]|uniref:hypothetical protein n=1 Tax=Paenibacillus sp. FSL H7-0690 TaxID=2921437 RepID=UPI0030EB40B8